MFTNRKTISPAGKLFIIGATLLTVVAGVTGGVIGAAVAAGIFCLVGAASLVD
jgi:hypothetical protein